MMRRSTAFILIVWLCLFTSAVHAGPKKDKASKRAAMMVQQLKQEMEAQKNAMQAEFDQQKKSMDEQLTAAHSAQRNNAAKLQGQLKRTQQLQETVDRALADKAVLEKQIVELQAQLQQQKVSLDQTIQALAMAKVQLDTNEAQRKTLLQHMATSHAQLVNCEEKNARLYSYGQELVSLYTDASLYQKVMRDEPFFQMKRVELENILQDKANLLTEQKVDTIGKP